MEGSKLTLLPINKSMFKYFFNELLKQSALNNLYKYYLLFEPSIVKLLATKFLHIMPKTYQNIVSHTKRNKESINIFSTKN